MFAVQTPFIGPVMEPTVPLEARNKLDMEPGPGALPPMELNVMVVAVDEITVAVPAFPKLPATAVAEIIVPAGMLAAPVIPVMLPFQEPFD